MLKKVNVDVLGIVENMAGLPMPDGSMLPVFGAGGGEKTAREFNVPLLANLPIDLSIREGGDAGKPVAAGEGPLASVFRDLALKVISILDTKGQSESRLTIVS